jgi:hypothetical protein
VVADSSAAGGKRLSNPNLGAGKIILSSDRFLTAAPGSLKNDGTLYAETDGGPVAPPPPACSALPSGWAFTNVGAPARAGDVCYNSGSGQYTLLGAGIDIWGTGDQFAFVYRQLAGDGQITARVATVQNVHAWTKTGVMMRDTLAAGSAHAAMFVTPAKGWRFNLGEQPAARRRTRVAAPGRHRTGSDWCAPIVAHQLPPANYTSRHAWLANYRATATCYGSMRRWCVSQRRHSQAGTTRGGGDGEPSRLIILPSGRRK